MPDEKTDVAGLVERAFLMGLGVLDVTREKVTNLASDLVERGRVSESEAKKVADRIGDIASEQQEAVRKTVDKESDRLLHATGVATKEDVDSLRAEIAELKTLIAARGVTDEEYTP